jgi:hypothetical protein
VPDQDPDDNLIFWQTNESASAEPPPDRAEWVEIIRATTPHTGVRVVLVAVGNGYWRVPVAQELPVTVGEGPIDIEPIEHKASVTAALRAAGKPVRD